MSGASSGSGPLGEDGVHAGFPAVIPIPRAPQHGQPSLLSPRVLGGRVSRPATEGEGEDWRWVVSLGVGVHSPCEEGDSGCGGTPGSQRPIFLPMARGRYSGALRRPAGRVTYFHSGGHPSMLTCCDFVVTVYCVLIMCFDDC